MNYSLCFADIFLTMGIEKDYSQLSDAELIDIFQNGEIEVFEEIYERYSSKIFVFIRKYMNDSPHSEDVFQEVFVKVYKHLHTFRKECKLSTWLYRIATNTCINEFKKKDIKTVSLSDKVNDGENDSAERGDFIKSPEKGTEEKVQQKESEHEIYTCIEKLPEIYREPFVLSEVQDLKYEEIAEVLKIPLGTVKFRIHSAKSKLREMLQRFFSGGKL